MSTRSLGAAVLATLLLTTVTVTSGDLNPPGAPTPTPGPEPRTAISAENTPGDADSVYRITAGGSYYLTGDVTGEPGKSGIEIAASDVTLDLNGFSVIYAAGALDGILVDGTRYSLAIHGGRVFGWPGNGVDAVGAVRSRITDITSTNNTQDGILLGPRSVAERCIVDANTGNGLVAEPSCTVFNCLAQLNGGDGIVANTGGFVRNCLSARNTGDGIEMYNAGLCLENTCRDNGASTGGAGISLIGAGHRVEGNLVRLNAVGITTNGATASLIVRNAADQNTTADYDITPGNFAGAIVSSSANVATANAWANFEY